MDILKAIETETLSKIEELVKSGDASFFSSDYSYKALNRALESSRKDVAKFLLSDKRCMVNRSSDTSDMTNSNTPMHNAVKLGDIEIVDTLLKRGASVSIVNSDGDSPLHLAFLRRYEGVVDRILSHLQETSNCKNVKNRDGLSHLHIACTRRNKNVISSFLEERLIDPSECVHKDSPSAWAGYSAKHFAVEFNSAEALGILSKHLLRSIMENAMIELDLLEIDEEKQERLSYFHIACLKENVGVVKKFVESGADVNRQVLWSSDVCSGYMPLHCALESPVDRPAKVELLLRSGAKIRQGNDELEATALHLAMYTGAVKNEENAGNPMEMLYGALLEKTSNFEDEYGLSLFHMAVAMNDFDTVVYLLAHGVDVDHVVASGARMYSHYSALHFAVKFDRLAMAKLLIERGADVNVNAGLSNETPLFFACSSSANLDFVKLLLERGARIDVANSKGRTLLHCLVDAYSASDIKDEHKREGILGYIERLVRFGLDVNARDNFGTTVLRSLPWFAPSSTACVRLLLKLGADVNSTDNSGCLSLDVNYTELCQRNPDLAMVLAEHFYKLMALGLYIHRVHRSGFNFLRRALDGPEIQSVFFSIRDEMDDLDNINLSPNTTMLDYLTVSPQRAAIYINNPILLRMLNNSVVDNRYPFLESLIKVQHRQSSLYGRSPPPV